MTADLAGHSHVPVAGFRTRPDYRSSGASSTWQLPLFEAVGLAALVQLQPLAVLLLLLARGAADGLRLPFYRLVELAEFSVCSGQGSHFVRSFRQRVRLLGHFKGLLAVTDLRVRTAGQEQG